MSKRSASVADIQSCQNKLVDSETKCVSDSSESVIRKDMVKRKYKGAATYKVVFKSEWEKDFPIRAVPCDKHKFHCILCSKNVSHHHQGLGNVKVHCKRDMHKKNPGQLKKQKSLRFASNEETTHSKKVTNAKVKVTNFLMQDNLPIATADHLGPLFKQIFPDSSIASLYSCGRTKTAAILNEAMAPQCHKYIVDHCKAHPYSVGTDGSNDTGVQK